MGEEVMEGVTMASEVDLLGREPYCRGSRISGMLF